MITRARADWDPDELPDLSGRMYLVTGANAGLGYFASEQLAGAGARVVLSGRNPNRLAAAHDAIEARVPGASVETLLLDVSNPGSIRAAAASMRGGLFSRSRLDGVLMNAGIVHTPRARELTRDGRELVFATNALGHFVLAAELLTTLAKSASRHQNSRLVWLGSMSTHLGIAQPTDFQLERRYEAWHAYVQSKLVVHALGIEADERLRAAGVPVDSVVAHPGYAIGGRTERVQGVNEPGRWKRLRDGVQPFAQSKRRGAASLVRALIDPEVHGGEYWGPRFWTQGKPVRQQPSRWAADRDVRTRVWHECERLTGIEWPLGRAARAAR